MMGRVPHRPGTGPFRRRKQTLPGFTLLELLLACAMIAVVIILLLPAFRKISHTSKSVKCTGNLRQIATLFNDYLSDHRYIYPPSFIDHGTEKTFWPALLTKNAGIKDLRAFICPAVKDVEPWLLANEGFATARVSYGINRYGVSPFPSDEAQGYHPASLSGIAAPGKLLLLVDCDANNQPREGWYSASYAGIRNEFTWNGELIKRHDGTLNALFCDGHVEPLKKAQLLPSSSKDAPWWQGEFTKTD